MKIPSKTFVGGWNCREHDPGDVVAITVVRDGKQMQLKARLKGEIPMDDFLNQVPTNQRGVSLDEFIDAERLDPTSSLSSFGLTAGTQNDNGVAVTFGIQLGQRRNCLGAGQNQPAAQTPIRNNGFDGS